LSWNSSLQHLRVQVSPVVYTFDAHKERQRLTPSGGKFGLSQGERYKALSLASANGKWPSGSPTVQAESCQNVGLMQLTESGRMVLRPLLSHRFGTLSVQLEGTEGGRVMRPKGEPKDMLGMTRPVSCAGNMVDPFYMGKCN